MRPEIVVSTILLYLISKPMLRTVMKTYDFDCRSILFQRFVALHNFALALFSGIVAMRCYPLVFQHVRDYGLEETLCDRNGTLWASGFGTCSVIFYLSKYWEFIDTWILVLKVCVKLVLCQ